MESRNKKPKNRLGKVTGHLQDYYSTAKGDMKKKVAKAMRYLWIIVQIHHLLLSMAVFRQPNLLPHSISRSGAKPRGGYRGDTAASAQAY